MTRAILRIDNDVIASAALSRALWLAIRGLKHLNEGCHPEPEDFEAIEELAFQVLTATDLAASREEEKSDAAKG